MRGAWDNIGRCGRCSRKCCVPAAVEKFCACAGVRKKFVKVKVQWEYYTCMLSIRSMAVPVPVVIFRAAKGREDHYERVWRSLESCSIHLFAQVSRVCWVIALSMVIGVVHENMISIVMPQLPCCRHLHKLDSMYTMFQFFSLSLGAARSCPQLCWTHRNIQVSYIITSV